MIIEAQVLINGSKETIWAVITDIENASKRISGIEKIEILEKPASGVIGLKWRETRKLFGKSASEVMWITEAKENEYYTTKAESHGMIYQCSLRISPQGSANSLTMTHKSEPQSLMAKLMAMSMGFMFKGMMRKLLLQDLNDIKKAVEQRSRQPA